MADAARNYLIRQFQTAWKLTHFHVGGLATEECLWRPADEGLHVRQGADGRWRADWPDHEGYDVGPPSIAWLTWHVGFWWSMVHNHSFGDGALSRENVMWPGNADDVRDRLRTLPLRRPRPLTLQQARSDRRSCPASFEFSPCTNLLPIRRLGLEPGQAAPVRAAWLPFPAGTLEPLEQAYRRTGATTCRYESAGGRFATDLVVDAAGFVTRYPAFWEAESAAS